MLVVAAEDYTGASPVQSRGPHYAELLRRRPGGQRTSPPTSTTSTPRGRRRARRPRRAQPLRRRRLGDGRRPGDPPRRLGPGQRRPARARRAARVPRLPQRGRQGALRRRLRRRAVHRPTSGTSSTTPRARSPATRCPRESTRGAACSLARLGRRHQRRAAVLLRRLPRRRRRRARRAREGLRLGRQSTTRSTGSTWGLNGPASAKNQDDTSSFLATSGILPTDEFPQFESWPSARWDKPGGPFDPHTGTQYVYSQIADVSYKRLTREVAVPAGGGSMTFWTSYDTEPRWDHLFVEARTPGGDDWTTLPDANGHTTTATGESCPAGWVDLHPQLAHYQTWDGVRLLHGDRHHRCLERRQRQLGRLAAVEHRPVGVRRQDRRDLHRLRQRLGDPGRRRLPRRHHAPRRHQHVVRGRPGRLGGHGPPDRAARPTPTTGSAPTRRGFPVGSSITTPDTVLMGSGIEGITFESQQAVVLGAAVKYLLQ